MKNLILLFFLFYLNQTSDKIVISDKVIEKKFYKWNDKTLGSIKHQLSKVTDSAKKKALINRRQVYVISLNSPAKSSGLWNKRRPLRYRFLKEILSDVKPNKPFFIVETEVMGEVMKFKNYLIQDDAKGSHVFLYFYYKGWPKVKDTVISRINLNNRIKDNHEQTYLTGSNSSDVILSEFNGKNIEARFYLTGTIPDNKDISEILKIDVP